MTSHLIDLFHKRATMAADGGPSPRSGPTLSSPPDPTSPADSTTPSPGTRRSSGAAQEGCTFCEIATGQQEAYKVYEDQHVLAFLDILPIRRGHLLVIPRRHYERVSHLPDELSAALGRALPRISRALCRVVEQQDFNIVSNQGHAQVVPHVHYHLVPAPLPNSPPPSLSNRLFSRTELDDAEGAELSRRIRYELTKEEDGLGRRAKL